MLALFLHLFVSLGGTFLGVDFKTLIVLDELAAILAAPLLVAALLRLPAIEAFSWRSPHWSHWLVAGAAAIPLQIFGGATQELVIEALPNSELFRDLIDRALEPLLNVRGAWDMAVLMLGAVVLAAVCEEVLFRGVLLGLLARGDRWPSAILLSALGFAFFHLDPIGLLARTLMGVFFGVLVWRSGSIFPAILAHGLNNLLALTALPFMDADAAPPTTLQATLLAVASGAVFAIVLAVWWRWSPAPTPGADSAP